MQNRYLLQIPSDQELRTINGWLSVGRNEYQAFRSHLIVVCRRDNTPKSGPALNVFELPPGAGYKLTKTKKISLRATELIQRSIRTTVTTKLFTELSKAVVSEVGLGVDLSILTGRISHQIQVKSGAEITKLLEQQLYGATSFEIENSEEITCAFSIEEPNHEGDDESRILYTYLMLWPWHLDVYLERVEFLRLKYKKKGIRRKWFRSKIAYDVEVFRKPLFRISYYEPLDQISGRIGSFVPDVQNAEEIKVEPFLEPPCPWLPARDAMEIQDLAREAFPGTSEDKDFF